MHFYVFKASLCNEYPFLMFENKSKRMHFVQSNFFINYFAKMSYFESLSKNKTVAVLQY